jgi:peroxiredoxin family protein
VLVQSLRALGEGIETHVFFTFWGFDLINKKTMGDLQLTSLGNSAAHMPEGLGGLPITTAMATARLKKSIADADAPEVPEFLEQIVDSGGHLWACHMSADMNRGRPVHLHLVPCRHGGRPVPGWGRVSVARRPSRPVAVGPPLWGTSRDRCRVICAKSPRPGGVGSSRHVLGDYDGG